MYYPMFFVSIGPNSGQQRENGANQKICHQSLLSSFSAEVHTANSSYFHNKINSAPDTQSLQNISFSPLSPSTTSHHFYNSWWLRHFLHRKKTEQLVVSSHLHTHTGPPTNHIHCSNSVFSFCPLTELLLSSHPTTCPLDPIPTHLLQVISPSLLPALTHIINTSLLTGTFPTSFKQARVTPLLKKPTLNTSLIEN